MMTADELKALLNSNREPDREQAIAYLLGLLTSSDKKTRGRGYELFEEGLNEALYQSCLNYGSLIGGFTHPLVQILRLSVEAWVDRAA